MSIRTERDITLEADPRSARTGRRFAEEVVTELGHPSVAEEAALLVSELVTNALLHAGTEVRLRIAVDGDRLHVDVEDGSAMLPARRTYDEEASTGRGLGMVELLAADCGVERTGTGKRVWFELELPGETPRRERPSARAGWGAVSQPEEDDVVVRLLDLPVQLYCAAVQQDDALLREYTLLRWQEVADGAEPPDDLAPAERAQSALANAIAAAMAAGDGEDDVDLDLGVRPSLADDLVVLATVLDSAERRAEEGELLTRPSLPEIRSVREWCFEQVRDQLGGARPEPWRIPDPTMPAVAPLPQARVDELVPAGTDRAFVASDDANRIIAVSSGAADLLGWERDELVGRRLVEIVPLEDREAHLAGFTRYLVTGEARLIGGAVDVYALHRDGRRVPITLRLESHPVDSRTVFVGLLEPRDSESSEPPA